MTAEVEVIHLVQRADWTRLSLAAEVNDGSRLLLAPGRRYREQTPEGVRGCDGERSWRMPAPDEDPDVHWVEGPQPPSPMLLGPGWLLRSSRLEVRGHLTACGRDALHVVATERPGPRRRIGPSPVPAMDIPSGLRMEPEPNAPDADPEHPGTVKVNVVGVVAREAGREAAKAARNFLHRLHP